MFVSLVWLHQSPGKYFLSYKIISGRLVKIVLSVIIDMSHIVVVSLVFMTFLGTCLWYLSKMCTLLCLQLPNKYNFQLYFVCWCILLLWCVQSDKETKLCTLVVDFKYFTFSYMTVFFINYNYLKNFFCLVGNN